MRTIIDLINLSTAVSLKKNILNRTWTGKEVSYNHSRVFGCRAFVQIPKYERPKLDNKAKQYCIFKSYDHEEFGRIQ